MYLEHFGLDRLPFDSALNSRSYVDLPVHRKALNVLLFGLRSGEGIVKLVGEVGTGKSALCRIALARAGLDLEPVFLPDPALPPPGFLAAIAEGLALELPARPPIHVLKNRLREHLIAVAREGRRVAIFLDEAQTIPTATLETLRLLSNIESSRGRPLQIVLIGQPELDERLARHALRPLAQRIAFGARLAPLDGASTRTYVERRLVAAGARDGRLFERAAVTTLHRASGGIPRLINGLAHKALMAAYAEDRVEVERRHVVRAMAESEGLDRWRIRPLSGLRRLLGRSPASPGRSATELRA